MFDSRRGSRTNPRAVGFSPRGSADGENAAHYECSRSANVRALRMFVLHERRALRTSAWAEAHGSREIGVDDEPRTLGAHRGGRRSARGGTNHDSRFTLHDPRLALQARPPGGQQGGQVERTDVAVAVGVQTVAGLNRTPGCQQSGQIKRSHPALAVQVAALGCWVCAEIAGEIQVCEISLFKSVTGAGYCSYIECVKNARRHRLTLSESGLLPNVRRRANIAIPSSLSGKRGAGPNSPVKVRCRHSPARGAIEVF